MKKLEWGIEVSSDLTSRTYRASDLDVDMFFKIISACGVWVLRVCSMYRPPTSERLWSLEEAKEYAEYLRSRNYSEMTAT